MSHGNGGKIFINYRRGGDADSAGRLFYRLEAVYDKNQLFMDVSTLGATNDFPEELRREVTECTVLLVIMGRTWLTAKSARGLGLGHQDDFVTKEIALALQLKKIVIPILIDGTQRPRED